MKLRVLNYLSLAIATIILIAALLPASFWFEPRTVMVEDGSSPNSVITERVVHREFQGSYQVVIRSIGDNDPVCDARSGVFTYGVTSHPILSKDMLWWAPGDARCHDLMPGQYIMETTWTIHNLFWGLVPPKHISVSSNVFTVS